MWQCCSLKHLKAAGSQTEEEAIRYWTAEIECIGRNAELWWLQRGVFKFDIFDVQCHRPTTEESCSHLTCQGLLSIQWIILSIAQVHWLIRILRYSNYWKNFVFTMVALEQEHFSSFIFCYLVASPSDRNSCLSDIPRTDFDSMKMPLRGINHLTYQRFEVFEIIIAYWSRIVAKTVYHNQIDHRLSYSTHRDWARPIC